MEDGGSLEINRATNLSGGKDGVSTKGLNPVGQYLEN
jgi:hypothetical protein